MDKVRGIYKIAAGVVLTSVMAANVATAQTPTQAATPVLPAGQAIVPNDREVAEVQSELIRLLWHDWPLHLLE